MEHQMQQPNSPKPEDGVVKRNRAFFELWGKNRKISTHTPEPQPSLEGKPPTQTPDNKHSHKESISPEGKSTNDLSHGNSRAPFSNITNIISRLNSAQGKPSSPKHLKTAQSTYHDEHSGPVTQTPNQTNFDASKKPWIVHIGTTVFESRKKDLEAFFETNSLHQPQVATNNDLTTLQKSENINTNKTRSLSNWLPLLGIILVGIGLYALSVPKAVCISYSAIAVLYTILSLYNRQYNEGNTEHAIPAPMPNNPPTAQNPDAQNLGMQPANHEATAKRSGKI